MDFTISGNGLSMLEVDLDAGERLIVTESCLVSMESDLHRRRSFMGGYFKRAWSLLCLYHSVPTLRLKNLTESSRHVMLTHPLPGELRAIHLANEKICLDAHALIARYGGVRLSMRWAGVGAVLAGLKPFHLVAKGTGVVWVGAYGGLLERQFDGEVTLDIQHLVAFEPQVSIQHRPASGILSWLMRRGGRVTRAKGCGKIMLRARSITALANRLNRNV